MIMKHCVWNLMGINNLYNNLYYCISSGLILFSTMKKASGMVCMDYNSDLSTVGKAQVPALGVGVIHPGLTSHRTQFHLSTSRPVLVFGSIQSNIENGQNSAAGNSIYRIKGKCLILYDFLSSSSLYNLYIDTDF